MTHQYESEILNKLMERDGFNIPSSVPPYEAEIKAYLINQVKQAYPKLTDYEAEWLLYNYTKHLPAEFPISSVADVTEATFENVVPYAYKSAILKGCTLVNVFSNATVNFKTNATHTGNKTINLTSTGAVCHSWWNVDLQTTKQYMLSINIIENTSTGNLIIKTGDEKTLKIFDVGVTGKQNIIFTPTNGGIRFKYESSLNTGTTVIDEIMLIEYQDGMENWDIPYFEGMQSVKMPVLTTSNEDGTKTNILTTNEEVELRGIGDVKDELDLVTGELTQRIGEVVLDGSSDEEYNQSDLTLNNTIAFGVVLYDIKPKGAAINNKFITSDINDNSDYEHSYSSTYMNKSIVWFFINKGKLSSFDVSGFRQWLSQNPITLQYQLATESIKTVDLTTVNEKGETTYFMPLEGTMNVQSSGEIIQPTFDMSVPVEATTQNLASFIDLEMGE